MHSLRAKTNQHHRARTIHSLQVMLLPFTASSAILHLAKAQYHTAAACLCPHTSIAPHKTHALCLQGNKKAGKLRCACNIVLQELHRLTIMSTQPMVLAPAAALRPNNTSIHSGCCLALYCSVRARFALHAAAISGHCAARAATSACRQHTQSSSTRHHRVATSCTSRSMGLRAARMRNARGPPLHNTAGGTAPQKKNRQVRMCMHAEDRYV